MTKTWIRGSAAVVLLAAMTIAGPIAPASALNSADGHWTQLSNGNYPDGTSDPSCHSTCIAWPYDDTGLNWSLTGSGQTGGVSWHDEIANAIKEVNNLPYASPAFFYENAQQGGACSLCVVVDDIDAGSNGIIACGQTTPNLSGNTVTGMTLKINSNTHVNWIISWADTYTGGTPYDPPYLCDFRAMIRHELVHALGEGHSSAKADLMYPGQQYRTTPESIDSDAQAALQAIYGARPSSGSACAPVVLTIPLQAKCQ